MHPARRALIAERFSTPGLVLAPMEGVHDQAMRALLTELGGFRWAVTEFVRVSQAAAPESAILALAPELQADGRTPCGVPVDVQLLGGSPCNLAATAERVARLGARAIDLNFGCPAKTVNRHDGGAALLKDSQRIFDVVAAVRAQVPAEVAVSAKLRLGWSDPDDIDGNAAAAAEGGADWLTIHGRTREAGYRPPALWGPIGRVAAKLAIPVVANGDLFAVADIARCRDETGLSHFMLGRGPLADPGLGSRAALAMRLQEARPGACTPPWSALLARYGALSLSRPSRAGFLPGRLKQWGMLASRHAAVTWVEQAKRLDEANAIVDAVRAWEQTAHIA